MTDQNTARLALPLLVPGQAEKETTHNEALTRLDFLVQPAVVAVDATVPPDAPGIGECWLLGDAPTGAWRGQGRCLAGWTAGGWRFVRAAEGFAVWCVSSAKPVTYRNGTWREGDIYGDRLVIGGNGVVGPRGGAIADPSGGSVADAAARATITEILAAMRQHGLIAR
ncbi:DUF2793 domain-containing protein [Sphingomonas sp. A2-49]|uniref:DUF2793 domain-containing protein n=1 Tax=Sphingomonas sp. A2-49 TaxID=1391375 RepID=UPI0021D2CD2F|nr:DUF2793 domain-containing protein [Sphingomonas sp. A2-49]MCU6455856.1 DUF2793 domain-containing protein [Sphingomonas sp. A2-49]